MSRVELRREHEDLSELAWAVLARLHEAEPERHVEFAIQEGLSGGGDS